MKKPKNKKMSFKKSSAVLPNNNFITGLGSIFNIRGEYFGYNTSRTGIEADAKALRRDWEMIGEDITKAEKRIKSDNEELCIF